MFEVLSKVGMDKFVQCLSEEMKAKQASFPKTVVYVRTFADCSNIYILLKHNLGKYFTDPPGYRLIDMFTAIQTREKKDEVLKLFF